MNRQYFTLFFPLMILPTGCNPQVTTESICLAYEDGFSESLQNVNTYLSKDQPEWINLNQSSTAIACEMSQDFSCPSAESLSSLTTVTAFEKGLLDGCEMLLTQGFSNLNCTALTADLAGEVSDKPYKNDSTDFTSVASWQSENTCDAVNSCCTLSLELQSSVDNLIQIGEASYPLEDAENGQSYLACIPPTQLALTTSAEGTYDVGLKVDNLRTQNTLLTVERSFLQDDQVFYTDFSCDVTAFEICGSGDDEDGDGNTDCADSDCVNSNQCKDLDNDGSIGQDDCDDMDPVLNVEDEDGDGITSCSGDCDDLDATLYPGAAYLESETDCMKDEDGDGWGSAEDLQIASYVIGKDCNDTDETLVGTPLDADCDGFQLDTDCNDTDETMPALDVDCDGTLAVDDCDDNDPSSTIISTDADCDTYIASEDCDDNDPNSHIVAEDNDCDGWLTAADCDDNNAASTAIANDNDCDGVITVEDCNDNDINYLAIASDNDCDGLLTSDDCNDNDDTQPLLDSDCDGALTTIDCDDADTSLGSTLTDQDCDGVLTSLDCDDTDVSKPNNDADCDGTLTAADCDDNNANSTIIADDADCDGVTTNLDCNDNDITLLAQSNDVDCDRVLTAADCDDNDASKPNNDADCDGVVTNLDCDDTNPYASSQNGTELCDGYDNNCDGLMGEQAESSWEWLSNSTTSYSSHYYLGNKFKATEDAVITSFGFRLQPTAGDTLTWYVYESSTESGTYTQLQSVSTTANSSSMDWHESAALTINVTAGNYYALVVRWTSSTTFEFSSSTSIPNADQRLPWGKQLNSIYSWNSMQSSQNFNNASSSSYGSRVTAISGVAEVDADGDGLLACEDCNDDNPFIFEGAAELDSSTACMLDADEDGYGDENPPIESCFTLDLYDSGSNRWSYSELILHVDGEEQENFTLIDADNGYGSIDFCINGKLVFLEYDGHSSYNDEHSYQLSDNSGNVLFSVGNEFGLSDPTDGITMIRTTDIVAGTDCDDSNEHTFVGSAHLEIPTVCTTDQDNDGYADSTPSSCLWLELFNEGTCSSWSSSYAVDVYEDGTLLDNYRIDNSTCYQKYQICNTGQELQFYRGSYYNSYKNKFKVTDSNGKVLYSSENAISSGPLYVHNSYIEAGTDCNDADANTFVGAASLDDNATCMLDADGDNYGGYENLGKCYTIELYENTGGSWSGASLELYLDDALHSSYALENADAGYKSWDICANGDLIEFEYIEGSGDQANSYKISTQSGQELYTIGSEFSLDQPSDFARFQQTAEFIEIGNDCDDSNASIDLLDADGDGFSSCSLDCNDQQSTISPNGTEICDGIDQDCDGVAGTMHTDSWTTTSDSYAYTRMIGNKFFISNATMLKDFSVYLEPNASGQNLDWYVYRAIQENGTYTLIHQSSTTTQSSDEGWYQSDDIYLNLHPGWYYYFGVGWSGAYTDYYYTSSGSNTLTTWSELLGGSYDNYNSGSATDSLNTSSTYYQMRTNTGTFEADPNNNGVLTCDDAYDMTSSCLVSVIRSSVGNSIYYNYGLAPNNYADGSCRSNDTNDRMVYWTAPYSGCATFESTNSNMGTVLSIFDDCPASGGLELDCDYSYNSGNSSEINMYVEQGQYYYVVIEGYYSDLYDVNLNINIDAGNFCP